MNVISNQLKWFINDGLWIEMKGSYFLFIKDYFKDICIVLVFEDHFQAGMCYIKFIYVLHNRL